ncbi:MAG: hypothetical protein QM692_24810 [Thermomicrobiales bacterium]
MPARDTDSVDDVTMEGRAPLASAVSAAGQPWVRPVAIAIMVFSLVLVVVLAARHLQSPGGWQNAPGARSIAAVIVGMTVSLMALAVVAFRPESGELRALVRTTVAWTVALLLALVASWVIIRYADPVHPWHGRLVQNQAEVEAFLAETVPPGITPILAPTGIVVKSLEFLSGDNVQVSGFYWQRIGPNLPDDFTPGLVPAEAVRDAFKQTEVYRYTEGDVETIGWYFETTVREAFDYTYFPFDRQDVWLRLWSRDFRSDVILTPDFSSYRDITPDSLPGIEEEFVYTGWTPRMSGFSMSQQNYNSTFGIGEASANYTLPEMYFNVILDRVFFGVFFEHFIFALAVAILLFGLLVLTTDDENLKTRYQLSTAGVLGACSGLLFAVILKHNQIRSVLGARGLSYIELIPLLLYLAIAAVTINAIVLASPVSVRVVHHRNNLWPVLLYWPILLGTVLTVTLAMFYNFQAT